MVRVQTPTYEGAMPSGHTETSTINQRRPLTETMRSVLRSVLMAEGHTLGMWPHEMTAGERNAARAMRHRGLLRIATTGAYRTTEAGRAAAAATKS